MSEWKQVEGKYDSERNIFYIDALSTDFVPIYFKYLMEYKGIPQDAKIHFNDKTTTLEEFLKEERKWLIWFTQDLKGF